MLNSVICQCSPTRSQNENHSKAVRLPQELVDEIVSYVDDDYTLLSCSRTCFSWRSAAQPRLSYHLTSLNVQGDHHKQLQWPIPLQEGYKLHLLPFIQQLYIRTTTIKPSVFTSNQLRGDSLYYFSALNNLRELWIDNLKLSGFIPRMKRYFGHLQSTLQSLTLNFPKGSCRMILYFIGFFPNLQDLNLLNFQTQETETIGSDALVPPSRPPLCGWLTFGSDQGLDFVKLMSTLHGKLRFQHMKFIFVPAYTPWVLNACVNTLETFQLCLLGESFFRWKGEGLRLNVKHSQERSQHRTH